MERDYIKLESTANAETVFSTYDKVKDELAIAITNKIATGRYPFEITFGPNGDILEACNVGEMRRLIYCQGFDKQWNTDTKRIKFSVYNSDNEEGRGTIKISPMSYLDTTVTHSPWRCCWWRSSSKSEWVDVWW